jgi:hypothetical protein
VDFWAILAVMVAVTNANLNYCAVGINARKPLSAAMSARSAALLASLWSLMAARVLWNAWVK